MALDFPSGPTVGQAYSGYIYDGEKWVSQGATPNAVRYDLPQGLTANQTAQARANIWVTKRNYIVNGGMQVSQENGTTTVSASHAFPVDQFSIEYTGTTGTVGATQLTPANSVTTPGGSPNRIQVYVGTQDTSVAATDAVWYETRLEGLRIADLQLGKATAKTFTIQFGVRCGLAGTYSVTVRNAASNRCYTAEYTIAAGEVGNDVIKSVTIPGDTTGTWNVDNTIGMYIFWALMCGTTYQIAPGSWAATASLASTNQTNWMGAPVNTVFHLFDVSLTEGSVAPPFQLPDYASELALCQRYYWKKQSTGNEYISTLQVFSTTQAAGALVTFPTTMRIPPAVSQSSGVHFQCVTATGGTSATMNVMNYNVSTNSAGITVTSAVANLVAGNATAFGFNNVAGYLTFTARL